MFLIAVGNPWNSFYSRPPNHPEIWFLFWIALIILSEIFNFSHFFNQINFIIRLQMFNFSRQF